LTSVHPVEFEQLMLETVRGKLVLIATSTHSTTLAAAEVMVTATGLEVPLPVFSVT